MDLKSTKTSEKIILTVFRENAIPRTFCISVSWLSRLHMLLIGWGVFGLTGFIYGTIAFFYPFGNENLQSHCQKKEPLCTIDTPPQEEDHDQERVP